MTRKQITMQEMAEYYDAALANGDGLSNGVRHLLSELRDEALKDADGSPIPSHQLGTEK